MIIDSHVHCWPVFEEEQRVESGAPLRDGSIERLVAEMDTNSVDKAVVVQAPWFMDGHFDYLKNADQIHPQRLMSGLLVDPRDATAVQTLEAMDLSGVVGIRVHLLTHDVSGDIAAGLGDAFFDWCSNTHMPVTLLFMERGHDHVVGWLARRFPALSLVLDHMGWLRAVDDPSPVCALARYSNLSLKLSGHVVLSESVYPYRDLWPQQKSLLTAFGADRLMWASNFPMPAHREATYYQRLSAVADLPFLDNDAREWILGKTAERLWIPRQTAT